MLLATAGPAYYGCAQQTFAVQNKPAVAPKTITIISSFLELSEKTVDAARICGGAENVVKTETQQTFAVDCSVLCWRCPPLEARVYCSRSAWVAHRYGQLYLLLINILLGSFQLFLHSDQPPLWGWNNPNSAVSVSRGCIITPVWVASRLTNCWCATDDDQRQHHHAEHHFQL